jgi:hypothetical protein
MPEILSSEERARHCRDDVIAKAISETDMPEAVIRQFASPPASPGSVFLHSQPRRCRRIYKLRSLHASLVAILIAHPADALHQWLWALLRRNKLGGILSVGTIQDSVRIGQNRAKLRASHQTKDPFQILQAREKARDNREHRRD